MNIDELFARPVDLGGVTPEQRLITATLDCIAEAGLEGATARAIAARADMNAAAINYYYRSKDNLVKQALQNSWKTVSEDVDRIVAQEPAPPAALTATVRYLIEGAWRYPRVIRALMNEDYGLEPEAEAFFSSLFGMLSAKAGLVADQGLGSYLFLSFLVFTGVDDDGMLAGFDLSRDDDKQRLAEALASRLFGLPPAAM